MVTPHTVQRPGKDCTIQGVVFRGMVFAGPPASHLDSTLNDPNCKAMFTGFFPESCRKRSFIVVWIDKSKLSELISDAQNTGRASEELAVMLYKMADGVWAWQCRTSRYAVPRDEYMQSAVCHILARLQYVDTSLGCFAYITTILRRHLYYMLREHAREQEQKMALWQEKYIEWCWEEFRETGREPRKFASDHYS